MPKNADDFDSLLTASINERARETLQNAHRTSSQRLQKCADAVDGFLGERGLDPGGLCLVVVGSVGRLEALAASDLDVIPVLGDGLGSWTSEIDGQLRQRLREQLKLKVSLGEELTKATNVSRLVKAETIGGSKDSGAALTRRILILSESAQAGGRLPIGQIRRRLLEAYGGKERTSGRHVLSLCNDLARYYRQLCIDYKAKVDVEHKDWCSRNIKLRHSRKFWYFSTLLAIAACATREAHGEDSYRDALLDIFEQSPVERLLRAVPESMRTATAPILKSFSWFLAYMARDANRAALASVEHGQRYDPSTKNPFPALKHNSDVLHRGMINLLEALDAPTRHRVLDWFLL